MSTEIGITLTPDGRFQEEIAKELVAGIDTATIHIEPFRVKAYKSLDPLVVSVVGAGVMGIISMQLSEEISTFKKRWREVLGKATYPLPVKLKVLINNGLLNINSTFSLAVNRQFTLEIWDNIISTAKILESKGLINDISQIRLLPDENKAIIYEKENPKPRYYFHFNSKIFDEM